MPGALALRDVVIDERPRERLRRLGVQALSDAELVAIVLGSGRPGVNAVDLAHRVIAECGGLDRLVGRGVVELLRLHGVGPAGASRLVAIGELARRAGQGSAKIPLAASADIAAAVAPLLDGPSVEQLAVVVLNRSLRLIDVVKMAEGATMAASVPTADILRAVLVRGGTAFALAHNHPGGSLEPSPADVEATIAVRAAAAACGVRFLDHIVVAAGCWRSINERDLERPE